MEENELNNISKLRRRVEKAREAYYQERDAPSTKSGNPILLLKQLLMKRTIAAIPYYTLSREAVCWKRMLSYIFNDFGCYMVLYMYNTLTMFHYLIRLWKRNLW